MVPDVAALEVYSDYRERSTGWPELPPVGLRVALHPEILNPEMVRGQKAVVVLLNAPQPEGGPSETPVPSFLADPTLDLTDEHVRVQVLAAGVRAQDYDAAMPLQRPLQDEIRHEQFGQDAVPSSQDAGQGIGYSAQSFHASSGYTAWDEAGPSSMNPSAYYAQYLANPSPYGQEDGQGFSYAPGGVAAMTQGMEQLTVEASANLYATHAAIAAPDQYGTSQSGGPGEWPPGVDVFPYVVNPVRGAGQYNVLPANSTSGLPTGYQPAPAAQNMGQGTGTAKGPKR